MEMKPTENYEQLLQRFTKRTMELNQKLNELQSSYDEYIKIEKDLMRLQGSLQAVEYLAYGRLPNDGNHTGMKDHAPNV
jgi:cell shape-determining protein MreC